MMFPAAKPLASLSSGLLARKGQARPAMRRQMTLAEAGDDLGWNDMGEPLPLAPLTPESVIAPQPLPPVLVEREELAGEIAAPVETVVMPAAKPATGRKAAFTLRLDEDRHLRLRLASATRRVSSQQLVTQALDAFLVTLPEVDALARRVPAADATRSGE